MANLKKTGRPKGNIPIDEMNPILTSHFGASVSQPKSKTISTKNSLKSTEGIPKDKNANAVQKKILQAKGKDSPSTTAVTQNASANLVNLFNGKLTKVKSASTNPKDSGANKTNVPKAKINPTEISSPSSTSSKGKDNKLPKPTSASNFIKSKETRTNLSTAKSSISDNSPSTSTSSNKGGKRKSESQKDRKSESDVPNDELASKLQSISLSPSVKEELPCNVLYYGWFFDEEISVSLKEVSYFYLRECYCLIPQFRRFMNDLCAKTDINDPFEYYKQTVKPKKLKYHVTAKFCGRERVLPYEDEVNCEIGKSFKMKMTGFYITPTSFGIRVQLTKDQMRLFDDERKPSVKKGSKKCVPNTIPRLNKEVSFPCSFPGLEMIPQKDDLKPPSSRAHITIGVSPGSKALQAGLDLLDICDLELRQSSIYTQDHRLPTLGALVRQFGRIGDAYVIYPTHLIAAEAIFKPFK